MKSQPTGFAGTSFPTHQLANGVKNAFRRWLVVVVLATTGAISVGSQIDGQEHVTWMTDVELAKETAARENKLVLLHFSASWCGPCKELERFVFVNPTTIRMIHTSTVPVKIDVDQQKEIAQQYKIHNIPADVIISPTGQVIAQQSSPRSTDGYLQMISHARNSSGHLTAQGARLRQDIRDAVAQAPTFARPELQQPASGGAFRPPVTAATGNSMVQSGPATMSTPSGTPGPAPQGAMALLPTGSSAPPVQQTEITSSSSIQFADSAAGPATIRNEHLKSEAAVTVEDQPLDIPETAGLETRPAGTGVAIRNPFATGSAESESSLASSAAVPQGPPSTMEPPRPHTIDLPPIGLEGYCGVTLMEDQRWEKGSEQFGCIHRGKLYLFASQAHLERFQMTPDMFSPLLGGADPVVYHTTGELVDGSRSLGVFYGGENEPSVIVLLSSEESRKKFEEDPVPYVQTVRQAMNRADGNSLVR